MGGYRVRVESDNPLAVDEALCRSQRFNQRLLLHGFLTLITIGLWSPVLIGWLVMAGRLLDRFSNGYVVTVAGGMLTVGSRDESRSVPLDGVADVSVSGGIVTVAVRGSQPVQLFGLVDPTAAAQTILQAREEHVRGIRVDVREEVLNAEAGVPRREGRARE